MLQINNKNAIQHESNFVIRFKNNTLIPSPNIQNYNEFYQNEY